MQAPRRLIFALMPWHSTASETEAEGGGIGGACHDGAGGKSAGNKGESDENSNPQTAVNSSRAVGKLPVKTLAHFQQQAANASAQAMR